MGRRIKATNWLDLGQINTHINIELTKPSKRTRKYIILTEKSKTNVGPTKNLIVIQMTSRD